MPRFEVRFLMFIFLLMILGKTNCCAPIFVFKQQVSKKSSVIYWAFGLDHYQNGWLLVQVSSPRKKHGFVDTATRGLWKAQEIFVSKSNELCYVSWKVLPDIIAKWNNKKDVSISFDIICNMHQGISIYWMVKMTYLGQHA